MPAVSPLFASITWPPTGVLSLSPKPLCIPSLPSSPHCPLPLPTRRSGTRRLPRRSARSIATALASALSLGTPICSPAAPATRPSATTTCASPTTTRQRMWATRPLSPNRAGARSDTVDTRRSACNIGPGRSLESLPSAEGPKAKAQGRSLPTPLAPVPPFYLPPKAEVCGLAWSPDGTTLASGGNDNLLCVWDARGSARGNRGYGSPHRTTARHAIREHCAAVKALAWCPFRRNVLASGGGTVDQTIKCWNTATGACIHSVHTGSQVCSLLWSPHERELLSSHGSPGHQLCLWQYPSMKKVADLRGLSSSRAAAVSHRPFGLDGLWQHAHAWARVDYGDVNPCHHRRSCREPRLAFSRTTPRWQDTRPVCFISASRRMGSFAGPLPLPFTAVFQPPLAPLTFLPTHLSPRQCRRRDASVLERVWRPQATGPSRSKPKFFAQLCRSGAIHECARGRACCFNRMVSKLSLIFSQARAKVKTFRSGLAWPCLR